MIEGVHLCATSWAGRFGPKVSPLGGGVGLGDLGLTLDKSDWSPLGWRIWRVSPALQGIKVAMPKLTPEERKEIFDRHRLQGLSIRQLSKDLGLPPATIKRWVDEGKKPNPCWSDLQRPGAPRKLSNAEVRRAKAKAKKFHTLNTVVAYVNANRKEGDEVSRSTVWRALHTGRHPLKWLPIQRQYGLLPDNIKNRLKFCEKHLTADVASWVFADSKFLYMGQDPAKRWRYAWQDEDDRPVLPKVKRVFCFHFYAFIAKGYKSRLYFTLPTALPVETNRRCKAEETFKSEHFVEVMEQALPDLRQHFGDRPFHICLDHAKQHKSHTTDAALKKLTAPMLGDFPSRSWDMNVIENAWGILNSVLLGLRRRTTTKMGHYRAILEAWEGVTQEAIDSLVGSVPRRMQAILEHQGEWLGVKK